MTQKALSELEQRRPLTLRDVLSDRGVDPDDLLNLEIGGDALRVDGVKVTADAQMEVTSGGVGVIDVTLTIQDWRGA